MLRRLLGIQDEDRLPVVVAFTTLVAILAGHAMLETARDALFLGKLPARYLALAYIAIAALALAVNRLNRKLIEHFSRRRLLSLSLFAGGMVTGLFWFITAGGSAWLLGALYVWTGLLATVVVMQFWLLLSDVLDVGRAKRLYGIVGAGGLVGATLGSLLAGALAARLGSRTVVLAAALTFCLAAILPNFFPQPLPSIDIRATRRGPLNGTTSGGSSWSLLRSDRYLQRLLLMLMLGAVLVTGVDYLFKATAAHYAQETGMRLGVFFARYYTVVNVLALIVQLLVAPRLLQAAGVNRALYILPLLLVAAAIGNLLSFGVISVLLLKGTDGTLRHSLHRTASEILYLPLARRTRDRFKGLSEALGQRGGQAIASLAILGVTALSPNPRIIVAGVVILALLWVGTLVGLQPLYLNQFRQQLRAGMLDTDISAAELDLASLEMLVSALSAEADDEVIAALEIFNNYGKSSVVPALILYHPSTAVVLRAFALLEPRRSDVQRLSRRLLKHDSPSVRARALRAICAVDPDEALLREALQDDNAVVHCTALAMLIGAELITADDAIHELRALIEDGDEATQLALARTIAYLQDERHDWVANKLAEVGGSLVLAAIARSLALAPAARHVPLLLTMLSDRESRALARDVLVQIGDEALAALSDALVDERLPRGLRLHVPRSISRFMDQRAMDILQGALGQTDPRLDMKIARGLAAMRGARRDLEIDQRKLLNACEAALRDSIRALHFHHSVETMLSYQAGADHPASALLLDLLHDRHRYALQHVFRLQHIVTPSAQFDVIYDGIRSDDTNRRASSQELLSHAASASIKESLLALTDLAPSDERLRRCAAFYQPEHRKTLLKAAVHMNRGRLDDGAELAFSDAYMAVLRSIMQEPNEALTSIVAHHLSELDLTHLRRQLKGAATSSRDQLRHAAKRAIKLFETRVELNRAR